MSGSVRSAFLTLSAALVVYAARKGARTANGITGGRLTLCAFDRRTDRLGEVVVFWVPQHCGPKGGATPILWSEGASTRTHEKYIIHFVRHACVCVFLSAECEFGVCVHAHD